MITVVFFKKKDYSKFDVMQSTSGASKTIRVSSLEKDSFVITEEKNIRTSDNKRKSRSGLLRAVKTSNTHLRVSIDKSSLMTHKVDYSRLIVNSSEYAIEENDLRILFWTPWLRSQIWWNMPHTSLVTCGDVTCQFTHDRSLYNQSDAVLFYFNQGKIDAQKCFPQHRTPKQHWVAYFDGPPTYIGIESMGEVGNVFNVTATYHHQADIHIPFGLCEKIPKAKYVKADYTAGKRGLVSWFVSHCNTHNGRENYVEQLKKFIPINIRGECSMLGAWDGLCKSNQPSDNLCPAAIATINSHKFYLSFENSNCVDYISEKVYKVMFPGMTTVPVIMSGVTNLKEILPPHSFIDAKAFASPEELAKFLLMLDGDDKLYNEYFTWRSSYRCGFTWRPRAFCCDFARFHGEKRIVSNITSIFGNGNCEESAPTYKGLKTSDIRGRNCKARP